MSIVCVGGGFDPLHIGHIRHFEAAAKYGRLTVILNSDTWLMRKKGYVFMQWEERAEIIRALRCVHDVVPVDDEDGTVGEALRRIMPNFYCKGGDRTALNTPELELCAWLNITPVFDVGGAKEQASSDLVKKAMESMRS
jgi:cytidyltransferase-like protein